MRLQFSLFCFCCFWYRLGKSCNKDIEKILRKRHKRIEVHIFVRFVIIAKNKFSLINEIATIFSKVFLIIQFSLNVRLHDRNSECIRAAKTLSLMHSIHFERSRLSVSHYGAFDTLSYQILFTEFMFYSATDARQRN